MASLASTAAVSAPASLAALRGSRVAAGAPNAAAVSAAMAPVRCHVKVETDEPVQKRRAVVQGAAAAALVALVSGSALAEQEPKKGSVEAKKKYSRICITMPTAAVCHG